MVLEGKYWKRRPDAVASEYRKWRYYREKKVPVLLPCDNFLVMYLSHYCLTLSSCLCLSLQQVRNVDPTLAEVREKANDVFVSPYQYSMWWSYLNYILALHMPIKIRHFYPQQIKKFCIDTTHVMSYKQGLGSLYSILYRTDIHNNDCLLLD